MAKLIHDQPAIVTLDLDKINLDEFTWGDLEDMESQSPVKIRQMIEKYAVVANIPPKEMGQFLRNLSLRQMRELSTQFQQAVIAMANPIGQNGKNSNGA